MLQRRCAPALVRSASTALAVASQYPATAASCDARVHCPPVASARRCFSSAATSAPVTVSSRSTRAAASSSAAASSYSHSTFHRARLLAQLRERARDTVLRRMCTPLSLPSIASAGVQQLARQLVRTMERAQGVGLAAPQCAQSVRMFVAQLDDAYQHEEDDATTQTAPPKLSASGLHLPPQPTVVINPIIHSASSRTRAGLEGCLSLPGLIGELHRPVEIDVSYLDEHGVLVRRTFTDFRARIFQHELDHLNGKLFIDHIDDGTHLWTDEGYERSRL